MSKLDPRIEAIRVKYGLEASDFWELPQKKGTWIAKHSALEIVATKANIVWSMPQIIEANGADGVAAMVVMGTLDTRSEWATGEASPKNNKNAYPWAMAEKRGKDRVVLKLSGIAGLVYSEDEADDFKQPQQPPGKQAERQKTFNDHLTSITKALDVAELQRAWISINAARSSISAGDMANLELAKNAKKAELTAPGNNFDAIERGDVK